MVRIYFFVLCYCRFCIVDKEVFIDMVVVDFKDNLDKINEVIYLIYYEL